MSRRIYNGMKKMTPQVFHVVSDDPANQIYRIFQMKLYRTFLLSQNRLAKRYHNKRRYTRGRASFSRVIAIQLCFHSGNYNGIYDTTINCEDIQEVCNTRVYCRLEGTFPCSQMCDNAAISFFHRFFRNFHLLFVPLLPNRKQYLRNLLLSP